MSQHRSFMATVSDMRKGLLQDELGRAYHDLVEQVRATGKAGSLTLTLKVSPLGKEGAMHQVVDDVKLALPKPDKSATLFFVTENNDHSLADPSQEKRTVREVPAAAKTVKEVSNG